MLDVAGGVSSFCAEANNPGIQVTAFDPIYSLSQEKIRERSDPALQRFAFTEIKTDFEFLVNSNSYLRVSRD